MSIKGAFIDDIQLSREQIRYLVKNYNTLEYSQTLRTLLNTVFKDVDFSCYSKVMLHRHLNDFLTSNYSGEFVLKYLLFRRAATKRLVAAFETKVQSSRVDFITVNGVSTSFEIKSELDNLDKLAKQATNYVKVFEYNYVVIDARHKKNVLNMLPPSYGILYFSGGRQTVERKALFNKGIDQDAQLSMLTKKELIKAFNGFYNRSEIKNRFTDYVINDQFKEALKSRYRIRWNFLVQHRNDILPIDLQFFFNRNVDPELIYNYG
jgi:hypothetical protein